MEEDKEFVDEEQVDDLSKSGSEYEEGSESESEDEVFPEAIFEDQEQEQEEEQEAIYHDMFQIGQQVFQHRFKNLSFKSKTSLQKSFFSKKLPLISLLLIPFWNHLFQCKQSFLSAIRIKHICKKWVAINKWLRYQIIFLSIYREKYYFFLFYHLAILIFEIIMAASILRENQISSSEELIFLLKICFSAIALVEIIIRFQIFRHYVYAKLDFNSVPLDENENKEENIGDSQDVLNQDNLIEHDPTNDLVESIKHVKKSLSVLFIVNLLCYLLYFVFTIIYLTVLPSLKFEGINALILPLIAFIFSFLLFKLSTLLIYALYWPFSFIISIIAFILFIIISIVFGTIDLLKETYSGQRVIEIGPIGRKVEQNIEENQYSGREICSRCKRSLWNSQEETVFQLECSHYYHIKCLELWMEEHSYCHQCKKTFI